MPAPTSRRFRYRVSSRWIVQHSTGDADVCRKTRSSHRTMPRAAFLTPFSRRENRSPRSGLQVISPSPITPAEFLLGQPPVLFALFEELSEETEPGRPDDDAAATYGVYDTSRHCHYITPRRRTRGSLRVDAARKLSSPSSKTSRRNRNLTTVLLSPICCAGSSREARSASRLAIECL